MASTDMLVDMNNQKDLLEKTPAVIVSEVADSLPSVSPTNENGTPGSTEDHKLPAALNKPTISPSPKVDFEHQIHPASVPILTLDDNDELDAFAEAAKKEIASARGGNTRAPKFNQHIKFSSIATESNTNANSYFGRSANPSPAGTPVFEATSRQLEDGSDMSDLETESSPRRRRRSRSHSRAHSRSRSRGFSYGTPHSGVGGHEVNPDSPSASFEHRVAFDTFDNKDASEFALTLQSKHEDYTYTRLSRTFLCGTDKNKYSENAVSWLMEELAEDGDEIVCLRVIDPSSKLSSSERALEEKQYREEAHRFLEHIMSKNIKGKKVSLVLEFAIGGVESQIKRMVEIHEPSILIVGTKGRSIEGFKGLLPGSVSKWCLQHSPIPVVVVKPRRKLENSKAKREANPNKVSYIEMIAAHPNDTPKVYQHMSSHKALAPQIPAFLMHPLSSASSPALTPSSPRAFSPSPHGIAIESTVSLDSPAPSSASAASAHAHAHAAAATNPGGLQAPESSERLGRFDRLRTRSRSPLPRLERER